MNKNEVTLVKAFGELEAAIATICKTVNDNYGSGRTTDLVTKLAAFKDKFFNILLEPEEEES